MTILIRRAALLLGLLSIAACASQPAPTADFAAPAPRHADAKTTLENHY